MAECAGVLSKVCWCLFEGVGLSQCVGMCWTLAWEKEWTLPVTRGSQWFLGCCDSTNLCALPPE
jgi:hypothetical protein